MVSGASKGLKGSVQAAFDVLGRVFGGGYADILLASALDHVAPESRPLVTETVYGVLRHHGRIDLVIDSVSKIKTKKMETLVLLALRIGVYRLLFLSGVPAYASINESVELVKGGPGEGKKRTGFVNAVLRKVDSTGGALKVPEPGPEGAGYAALYYSHPEWLVRRWVSRYGAEGAVRLCKANLTVPPRTIRVNTLVTSKEALVRELEGSGFTAVDAEYSPAALKVTGTGRLPPGDPGYYIADEASQLVAYLLGPGPGETVLDACAAPGGKSSQIGALMENSGALYAMDKNPARARVLARTLRVQGVSCALVIVADAGAPLCFKEPAFDAILADAPCSGLGVLGRSPDIKLRREESDLDELSKIQTRLLDNLSGYLKKGGRMVYSVCTLEPEETVEVVERFLERHPAFALLNAREILPKGCAPLVDESGYLRTLPHLHGTDGFFAARFERTG
jgi:16S rRNA (cytosine967-C5)-methyltransferase